MSTILEALANDDLHVLEITDKDKELLARLINTIYDETVLYAQHKFKRGYQLEVLMAAEVFSGKDTFLNQNELE